MKHNPHYYNIYDTPPFDRPTEEEIDKYEESTHREHGE